MEYKIQRSNDSLMHYGVPGMKWGVRKQEYVPTGYSKRKQKKYLKKYNKLQYKIDREKGNLRREEKAGGKYNQYWYDTKEQIDFYKNKQKKYKIPSTKTNIKQNAKTIKKDLTTRFEEAKKKNPSLTYDKMYKSEIGKSVAKDYLKIYGDNSYKEDTSYYKEIEDKYLKSLGF